MGSKHFAAVMAAVCGMPLVSSGAPLFTDNFNTAASSANYATATSDGTSSFATYAYDYSQMGIPSAPNSGDGTRVGLKLDANFSAPGTAESVTLHTVSQFTGDYSVKFDAWLNVNGPFPEGGTGSTNYLTGGVGGNGTTNNRGGLATPTTGIGGWFAVNGDNGNGTDYRLHKNTTLQAVTTGQYAAGTHTTARDGDDPYYASFGQVVVQNLPVQGASNGGPAQQTGTSYAGAFGMEWHQVELLVDADGGTGGAASMQWIVDGLLLGTLDAGANGAFASTGSVTLGYSDPSSNLSDNPPLSFGLIDNLRVEQVPEPTALALAAPAALALLARRRRNA